MSVCALGKQNLFTISEGGVGCEPVTVWESAIMPFSVVGVFFTSTMPVAYRSRSIDAFTDPDRSPSSRSE